VTLFSDRRRAALQRGIEVVGLEHLAAAVRAGRGTVLVSVHLGDFDLGGSWLAQVCGHEVVAVVGGPCARLRAEALDRMRRRCGIIVRREENTSIGDLSDDLARGRIVSLMLDRRPNAVGVELCFLGRPAAVSTAPLSLARRTGATVLVAGLRARKNGGHLVRIAPAAVVPPRGDGVAWLQSVVDQLAELVRWAPEQWHIPPGLSQLLWT
jgi:KDO2-lipid IV(A) lauroyltransferase